LFPSSLKEYEKDLARRRATERAIQLLIEECMDISNTLLKELKLGLPEEEENIFRKLAEKGVISEEMAEKLKRMRKFRNVLIHKYAKVDDRLAYENIFDNHHDFEEFKKEVLSFLREQRKKKK